MNTLRSRPTKDSFRTLLYSFCYLMLVFLFFYCGCVNRNFNIEHPVLIDIRVLFNITYVIQRQDPYHTKIQVKVVFRQG